MGNHGQGVAPAYTYNKYSQNRLIAEAMGSVPGLAEVIAVREQAEALLAELRDNKDQVRKYDPYSFFQSGKIAKDWLDSLADQCAEDAATGYKLFQVGELIKNATAELEFRTDDASDAILAYLNGKLQELLAPLNGAAEQLAGVDSPTEAIRRGVSDAWRTFANAGEQYRELVDAQTVVLMSDPDRYDASQSQRSEDRRANTARMRNLDEVWPEWSVPARDSLDGYLTFVDTPWPVGDDGFLLWCVRNRAVLWVPTADELSAVARDRRDWIDTEVRRLAELDRQNPGTMRDELRSGNLHPAVQSRVARLL